MFHYVLIGLGGCLGAIARFLIQQWAAGWWGADFPYGTLVANVTGSFILGFFMTLAWPPEYRLFVAVGFLGGFTTFSSFSYDTLQLVERGSWAMAGLNFLGNTGLSFIGVSGGVLLARALLH